MSSKDSQQTPSNTLTSPETETLATIIYLVDAARHDGHLLQLLLNGGTLLLNGGVVFYTQLEPTYIGSRTYGNAIKEGKRGKKCCNPAHTPAIARPIQSHISFRSLPPHLPLIRLIAYRYHPPPTRFNSSLYPPRSRHHKTSYWGTRYLKPTHSTKYGVLLQSEPTQENKPRT